MIMANLAKVFKFSIIELFILLEAWFAFFKWDILISFTQYGRWRSEVGNLPDVNNLITNKKNQNVHTPEQVKLIIKLSEIAGRFHIRKMNCLRRCLSQKQLLAKRGFNTCMHIGVSIEEDKLKAHAWLTLKGQVINDSEDVLNHYSELKAANKYSILHTLK